MAYSEAEFNVAVKRAVQEQMLKEKSTQPTESHADHIFDCPECFIETIHKLLEKSEFECSDCGLPLGSEKLASNLKECPKCHGHGARKVER